jgi:hypothetical protein
MDDDTLNELLDELGIWLDLGTVAGEIEPLLEALVARAPKQTLAQAAAEAVEAVWSDELEVELVTEFEDFRNQVIEDAALELVPSIDFALADLRNAPRESHVVHALVWRAAAEMLRRANRNYDLMQHLEESLLQAPRAEHRRLAVAVAAAAVPESDIGFREALDAIEPVVSASLDSNSDPTPEETQRTIAGVARTLGTDARRRKLRASLAELAKAATSDFPTASAEVQRLVSEPMPDDSAKDDLWVRFVAEFARDLVSAPLGRRSPG